MKTKTEILNKLKDLRKQYEESRKNPLKSKNPSYLNEERKHQLDDELHWISEIAVLEWVLEEEKAEWLTSWKLKERDESLIH